MLLSFGLGLSGTKYLTGVSSDWANYDGSQDGSLVNLYTSGGNYGSVAASISGENKILVAHRDGTPGGAGYYHLSFANNALSEIGSEVKSSYTDISFPKGAIELEANRVLVAFRDNGGTSDQVFELIDTSGTSPVILDTANEATRNIPAGNGGTFAKYATNKAIYTTQETGSGDVVSYLIDIASDTLTVTAPQEIAATLTAATDGVTVWGGNGRFLWLGVRHMVLASISGTTITADEVTATDGFDTDSTRALGSPHGMVQVATDKILAVYRARHEASGLNNLYANVFDISGGTISYSSATEIVDDITGGDTGSNPLLVNIDGEHLYFVYENGSADFRGVLFHWNSADDSITVINPTKSFTTNNLDHVALVKVNDYTLAFMGQNESSTPVKQLGTGLIQAYVE